jgi:hypothetical protein
MTGPQLYEIEKIIGRKVKKGKKYYLVKWKGYSSVWNSWEPQRNFSQSKELIADYERSYKDGSLLENSKLVKKPYVNAKAFEGLNKKPIKKTQKPNKEILARRVQIRGDFDIATPKRINNHVLLDTKGNKKEEIFNKISFEVEWNEKTTHDNKEIIPSFQNIQKVKENCPLLLCQYYENFLEFK